ncbi:MAG: aldehyde dehydrogenase [Myxococcales bacterium]|nr:aldehyde dehydrogenase [Myxococcales bacterium]
MQRLSSWIAGEWRDGAGDGSRLYNPTSEEVVALASTEGLNLGQAFDYARDLGGQALRKMTFAERGALLKAMAKAIHAEREALIDIGRINAGNTRGDAKFDIDGASGTLMYYAKLGAALGERRTLIDGDPIQIGGARLQGQHILSSKPGVAVHINAFNFPAWGLAEKAACAILAGMPVISKPATSTAYMTWAMVRALSAVDSLPDGVLSLVCGSAYDLLDHIEWPDVVAFTGGAETADRIRRHPRVLQTAAALNIEADSLNSTVLSPGAKDLTYDAFIRDVALEMTQKAGQKCTATRRILVPSDKVDEFVEDIAERLDRITVGDPGADGVHMGPLATATQLKSAQSGIHELMQDADLVYGSLDRGAIKGVADECGYFLSPLVLQARDSASAKSIHELEVFGPVSTILPYDGSVEMACELIQKGQGGLVASVYADERDFLAQSIDGLAPWSGRVVLTDAKIAEQAYAPGMALPHLLHGGPGRAGGGEELGGTRGMRFYQQRTAIQGNGPLINKFLQATDAD